MPHPIPSSMRKDLDTWNNGAGVGLETWVEFEGNYKLAVGYAALLWPRIKAVGKYIVFEHCLEKSIKSFENQRGSTPLSVEAVLNHVHLADLHNHDDDHISADKLLFLGQMMKEMWSAKLNQQFPDRPCTVKFFVPDDREDLMDYQVTFWQTVWETSY